MSRKWQQDVLEFMNKFNQDTPCDPCVPDDATITLRRRLITQEYLELFEGLQNKNLPEIVDGCIDLIYVVLGTAVSCGVDLTPIWDKVHGANMMKEPYTKERAAELSNQGVRGIVPGKVLKPLGWQPPNIERAILEQMTRRGVQP